MNNLPAELGRLNTPSPKKDYSSSQLSSNSKFIRKIVGLGELFKSSKS